MSVEQQWLAVLDYLRDAPAGESLAFDKATIAHPREAGAHVSVGWPTGQLADYRFPPDSACRGLHVHEHPDRWVAHLDRVHPDCDVGEHLRRDAHGALLCGGAVLGAVLGGTMTKKGSGALAGAGLGLLAAALLISTNEE